jgi:hypothetical protein
MEQLKKSYLNRKLITFVCENCGKEAQKPESEYKRNLKEGRKNFCSRSCSASYNNKHRVTTKRDTEFYSNIAKLKEMILLHLDILLEVLKDDIKNLI